MAYASIDELRADPDYQSLKSPEAKQQIENEFLQNLAEQKNKARPDYDINPREANIAQVTKWEDVEKDPDFQKLSDEGKARFIDEFRNAGGTYTPSVGKEISDTIQGGGSTIAYGGKKMMYGLGEMGTRLINNLPGGDTEAQAQAATKFFQDRERDNDTTYARQRYIYGQTEGGRAGLAHGEQVSDAGAALLAPIAPYLTAAYFAAKGAGQTYADTKSLPQAGMSATLGYAGARFAPEIPVFGKGGVIREGTEALSRFNPVAYSGLQKINRTAQVASDILNKVPGGKAVTTSLQNAGRSGVNNAIIGTATTTASQLGQGKSFPEAVQAGVESMPENFALRIV